MPTIRSKDNRFSDGTKRTIVATVKARKRGSREEFRLHTKTKKDIQEIDILMPLAVQSREQEIEKRVNNFPSTRYYGSKRRLLRWVYENIRDVSFDTVLDGFGGTASVSLLFKAMGKSVTYHDALTSNTISAKALLANLNPVTNAEEAKNFFNSITDCDGLITNNFKGIFYKEKENRWLDGAVKAISAVSMEEKRSIFLYSIFQACLKKRPFNLFHRANLYLRLNENAERSFGNLVTWNAPFADLALQAYSELSKCIWDSTRKHMILNAGDVCELASGYDLVYFDPPYINGGSAVDDYLRRYHFLEGLAIYDRWLKRIDTNSKCLAFKANPSIKKWHEKDRFRELLFDLIAYHQHSVVVLSYVKNAYPSIEEILHHFKQHFSQTRISFKCTSQALSKTQRDEVLFIGLP